MIERLTIHLGLLNNWGGGCSRYRYSNDGELLGDIAAPMLFLASWLNGHPPKADFGTGL